MDTLLPSGALRDAEIDGLQSLDALRPGAVGVIRRIRADGRLRRRLLEMGFVSGTDVRVVRRAPLADPIEVVLHGYHLSIRRADAAAVLLDPK